jgi:hypothetical protein
MYDTDGRYSRNGPGGEGGRSRSEGIAFGPLCLFLSGSWLRWKWALALAGRPGSLWPLASGLA